MHAVVGRTFDGLPVLIDGVGGFKSALNALRAQGIAPAEILHQFIFVLEWLTRDLAPGTHPAGMFVRVYDLRGIGLLDIADKEAMALGQQMTDIIAKHYPERMVRAFVVNAPAFFSSLWRVVRPMLDPRTAAKITVTAGARATLAALREVMDDSVIPMAYGGTNTARGYGGGFEKWYTGAEECAVAELARRLNIDGNVTKSVH